VNPDQYAAELMQMGGHVIGLTGIARSALSQTFKTLTRN
jgi:hypothetical protein